MSVNYRIEGKPGGGFIAHSSDPAVPPIEAATHAELTQKIRSAAMSGAISGLELPTNLAQSALQAAAGTTAQRSIVVTTGNGRPHAATQEEIEQFAGLLGKSFPELTQAMAARIASAKLASDADQSRLTGPAEVASNDPIVPERGSARIFGILMALLALASLVYLFVLRR